MSEVTRRLSFLDRSCFLRLLVGGNNAGLRVDVKAVLERADDLVHPAFGQAKIMRDHGDGHPQNEPIGYLALSFGELHGGLRPNNFRH